ncbi:MAG TPA: hypothetical protein VM367_10740, partial [Pseudonocardia sp.]|nr:hypothetical protein [Pseudonocardia sp.]
QYPGGTAPLGPPLGPPPGYWPGPGGHGAPYPAPPYPGPHGPAGHPPPWALPPGGPYGGAPPPRRTGRIVALVLAGVLVLAGLGVGAWLLLPLGGSGGVDTSRFQTIRTPEVVYAVPPDWRPGGLGSALSVLGIDLPTVTTGPRYECGAANYYRGLVASGTIPRLPFTDQALGSAAAQLATNFYRSTGPPSVTVGPVQRITVGGAPASRVEATVTTPTDDGCLATEGVVVVLAIPLAGDAGTALVVVNGDLQGGPDRPPSPDRPTIDAIVESVALPSI